MYAKLSAFWKGAVGAVAVFLVALLVLWVVLVTLWALHGQQAYTFIDAQLKASQAQQQPVQPKPAPSPPKTP